MNLIYKYTDIYISLCKIIGCFKYFEYFLNTDTAVQAETVVGSVLFFTPVGRSFKCHRDIVINLYDSRYPDIGVELSLRKLKIEPFIFKNNDFGPGNENFLFFNFKY